MRGSKKNCVYLFSCTEIFFSSTTGHRVLQIRCNDNLLASQSTSEMSHSSVTRQIRRVRRALICYNLAGPFLYRRQMGLCDGTTQFLVHRRKCYFQNIDIDVSSI